MDFLNEQNNGLVRLDGTHLQLPTLSAWQGSSAVFWVRAPFACLAMSFKVGNADGSAYAATLAMTLSPPHGLWRAYIPGRFFTTPCETRYKVVCKDSCGERHVCGEGILRIQGGAIPDAEDGPVSSDGCFVQFPDGKWRKVTVFTDAAGEMSFLVEQDGFVSDDFADAPTQPYAYEKASGLYYALSGFIDEAGEAYLAISPDGVSGQAGAFALDPKTGLYHRVFTIASLPSLPSRDRVDTRHAIMV